MIAVIANDLEFLFQADLEDLAESDLMASIAQDNINHFMLGINLFVSSMGQLALNIHWSLLGIPFVIFACVQSFVVSIMAEGIMNDFLIVCLFAFVSVFCLVYSSVKIKKANFLKTKKIQMFLNEQMKIF